MCVGGYHSARSGPEVIKLFSCFFHAWDVDLLHNNGMLSDQLITLNGWKFYIVCTGAVFSVGTVAGGLLYIILVHPPLHCHLFSF